MAVGDRGKIFSSIRSQKVVLGADEDKGKGGGGKEQILDPIYVNFLSFKKGVLERISACGFLHGALCFNSKR